MNGNRPGNDTLAGDELMRRILASQRTIIEQNAKIVERQGRQQNEKDNGDKTEVPLTVKVSAEKCC